MELGFATVDQVCTKVDLTSTKPVIDLSYVTFVRPFGLIYLGMFLRYHNSKGKTFSVLTPPPHSDVHKYLDTQNFWNRFNFNADTDDGSSVLQCKNCTSLNDIVDIQNREYIAEDVAEDVLKVLQDNGIQQASMITEVVSELVDNFACHSKQNMAALMMQYYPKLHEVVIAIGDCGIGIRASLSSNTKYTHLQSARHYEAILQAFEPLVTCKQEGGTGLTMVRENVIDGGGYLILSSGDEYVRINKYGTKYGTMSHNLSGVQIEIVFLEGN